MTKFTLEISMARVLVKPIHFFLLFLTFYATKIFALVLKKITLI